MFHYINLLVVIKLVRFLLKSRQTLRKLFIFHIIVESFRDVENGAASQSEQIEETNADGN